MNIENTLWVEKFRPSTLDGYIGNELMISKFQSYIDNDDIPQILLWGIQGTGKTTAAKILANALDADIMMINASDENNVETIRTKIKGFASSMGFSKWKIVILDECLERGTLISILRAGYELKVPIENVDEDNDLIKSYNLISNSIEWMPFKLWDNGEHEIWEIELENNTIIRCTENHKWYVKDSLDNTIVVKTKDLYKYMHILSPI